MNQNQFNRWQDLKKRGQRIQDRDAALKWLTEVESLLVDLSHVNEDLIFSNFTLTPVLASVISEVCGKGGVNFRLFKPTWAAEITRRITQGEWEYNGQPIIINRMMELKDGQHRVSAIAQAGIGVQTTLGFYPIVSDRTLDAHAPRTASSYIAKENLVVTKGLAGAVVSALGTFHKTFIEGNPEGYRSHGFSRNIPRAKAILQDNPDIEKVVAKVRMAPDGMSKSILGAVAYAGYLIDADLAMSFLDQIIESEDSAKSTRTAVVDSLLQRFANIRGSKRRKGTMDRRLQLALFVQTFNSLRADKGAAPLSGSMKDRDYEFPVLNGWNYPEGYGE